ncbi:glycosyltransferase [Rufibacter tibetensis]|uniref:glycosyltransferase n=1 Tax=Rufibacter tibetensis TaxID=512763 RepID=UPI000784949E|nr:glycosyltransferase [Rufibacter tibetensis]
MKFWLLTTEYPPQFGGGIGTYCYQWANILKSTGHEITVFLPNKAITNFIEKEINDIRVIEFSPFLVNTAAFLGYETMISYSFAEIVKIFVEKEGVPAWIEAQEYNGIAYFLLQKKHLGYPLFKDLQVLITCHAPSFLYFEFNHINNYKLPYFWIGEMEKYCIQAADVCISPSQYLIDRLLERHTFNKTFHVLPNPFKISHKAGEEVPSENSVVFLAKLSPSKGILQTLQSFKNLWRLGLKFKLKLVGDRNYFYHAKQCMMGDYIKKTYSEFIKQGLLEMTGVLPPEKVQAEIRAAKMVLVPSTVDNFPYTVVECMEAKKVVLASEQGGHCEIIEDGLNGFLFDHNKPGALEEKIIQIFSLTKEQLDAIGNNAAVKIGEACNPTTYYNEKLKVLNACKPEALQNKNFVYTQVSSEVDLDFSEKPDEMQECLLSVVIPYYNMGHLVKETINSIKSSSYQNIEIIVLDDGSDSPESLMVLQELRKDKQIKVVNQKNRGLAEARNAGALHASSKYLAFLDADDTVHPAYYSKAVNVLKSKPNVHFVGCWVQYFENSTSVWPAFNPEPPYLLYHNMVNSSGLVYKKDSFLASGLNDKGFVYGMEDYDSVMNMVANGYKGVVLPEVLFNYRVRKNSMARGFNNENKSYLYKILAEKHKSFYGTFGVEVSNLLNANGPGFGVENPTMDYHLFSGSSKSDKVLRKLFSIIKQQPLLRKIALAGYSKVKSN